MRSVVSCAAPVENVKMTEPSKVLHIRNVGQEISEVRIHGFTVRISGGFEFAGLQY